MDRIQAFMPATSSGNKITFKIIFSYFFDYAVVAVLAVVYAVLDKILTPFAQPFSVQNISLMYPMAVPERIPIWMAMVYSCFGPAVVIAIYTLLLDGLFSKSKKVVSRAQRYTWGDRLWELNCGILGLFLAQGAAFVITGSLKNLIGKPRPDLLFRCQLPPNITDPGLPNFGLVHRDQCTQKDPYILQDGFRSFPSGHSSSSFAGLFYLSLYLAAKLHVLDQRGEVWRTFIVMLPTLGAAMIAGSRIIDARHHPFDVMFGSALGLLCGWAAYRQYFPPVSHTWEKGRAYPMRTWGVPLRRPEGVLGTDGQIYGHHGGKFDRTAHAMADEDDIAARESLVARNMDAMPAPYAADQAQSFQAFQKRGSSPGVRSRGSDEDTDYEHVRLKTSSMMPVEGLSRSQGTSPVSTAENAFRKQIQRNEMSRDDGEQDLAQQRPLR